MCDLWQYLKQTHRPIIFYGTGDGGDKLKAELDRLGVVHLAQLETVSETVCKFGPNMFVYLPVEIWKSVYGDVGRMILLYAAEKLPRIPNAAFKPL